MIPKGTPAHKEIIIPKWKMLMLPQGYEKTEFGNPKGSLAQYRGPGNIHVLEYLSEWRIHWDYGDPRTPSGLLVHVFADSPEVGFSLLAAVAAGKETYEETESISEALVDAAATGLAVYGGVLLTKEFLSWITKQKVE